MSKLYIIPTPIGNLEDITLRAIRILGEVDRILAEDTRVSKNLLRHYNIKTQISSYHLNNEHKKLNLYVNKIKEGETIALISDAGTPAISDPGFLLIRECIKNNIKVECLPGPNAFVPALVNSGIPCDRFIFEGFLPIRKGRRSKIESFINQRVTIILYESPHRIIKTLKDLKFSIGEQRNISISREISKLHEETVRGSVLQVLDYFEGKKVKGEFVIIIEGKK
tara:strand:+ start:4133 stop:4804 length:672 start_codon:yes stop_codon:yes gene_type:complete